MASLVTLPASFSDQNSLHFCFIHDLVLTISAIVWDKFAFQSPSSFSNKQHSFPVRNWRVGLRTPQMEYGWPPTAVNEEKGIQPQRAMAELMSSRTLSWFGPNKTWMDRCISTSPLRPSPSSGGIATQPRTLHEALFHQRLLPPSQDNYSPFSVTQNHLRSSLSVSTQFPIHVNVSTPSPAIFFYPLDCKADASFLLHMVDPSLPNMHWATVSCLGLRGPWADTGFTGSFRVHWVFYIPVLIYNLINTGVWLL